MLPASLLAAGALSAVTTPAAQAATPIIQAESYSMQYGTGTRTTISNLSTGTTYVGYISNNDYTAYDNVDFGAGLQNITITWSSYEGDLNPGKVEDTLAALTSRPWRLSTSDTRQLEHLRHPHPATEHRRRRRSAGRAAVRHHHRQRLHEHRLVPVQLIPPSPASRPRPDKVGADTSQEKLYLTALQAPLRVVSDGGPPGRLPG